MQAHQGSQTDTESAPRERCMSCLPVSSIIPAGDELEPGQVNAELEGLRTQAAGGLLEPIASSVEGADPIYAHRGEVQL